MLISVMSSRTAYMELSSLRVKDKAMYCWARNTVWGHQARINFPAGKLRNSRGRMRAAAILFTTCILPIPHL